MADRNNEARAGLPTGDLTFLFTDMAGSSRMWEQHGDRFIPVWQAHDAILRDAIARFGGFEVKSEGDSFMVAFPDAARALHCALFAQAALARYPWPADVGQPSVRMGLHSGEPFCQGNDYFGPVVNRAAHVCAAAHGGQVVLTDEAMRRLHATVDPKVTIQDLGAQRLKDMGEPIRLYEARHPSVQARPFPPLRTLEGRPNNLPLQTTSFVGRAKEIEAIAAHLAQGEKPILTVVGPGGIGKTRLTLQAAAAIAEWFPDGVWYIRLSEARDVAGAAVEVAATLGIPLRQGRPPLEQVRAWMADRSYLLILDDANTVPQADRLIRELLSGNPNVRCLATARESLQIDEADEIELSGLPTAVERTETGATEVSGALTDTDAGRLFLDRATETNPFLSLTDEETNDAETLLRDLEGVPNSIERAAALMDRVSPSVVLEWLNAKLAPDRVSHRRAQGVDLFRGILRRSAQKVKTTVEQSAHESATQLGQLLQGIADVATDRQDARQASNLGRESLRISHEAGDELGVAAALRQLARIKWTQGDRQSSVAMLAAALQIYRTNDAPECAEVERELHHARQEIGHEERSATGSYSVDHAVALAMSDDEQSVRP